MHTCRCNGNERSLNDCASTSGDGLDHSRDVGVQCRRPTPCTPAPPLVSTEHIYRAIHAKCHGFKSTRGSSIFLNK